MSEATNSDQADADRAAESGRVQMDDHPTLDRLPESLLTASLDDASGRSPLESLPLRKLEQGDLIANRYQIRQQIGRGGFGDVFRATDRELQRDVAIKACNGLRSFVGGRIRVEAQAIASLNHPNIVSIFDLVKQGDQELLIVMEFLEGETFRELITQGNLQSQGIAECMLSVALALDHAHRRHLVHSDLKPGNLFRTTDGTVKLLDFGLAVAYVPGKPSSRLGGTPGYMAPEQIRGESHRIDGRTDIWAAGIVLFEWLTGVKPFVGSGAEQVARAALNEETPSPRSLNPAIDDELCRIVRKCLAKRMADRYQTGQDLADDLHHWLARHPSRGIGPASRTRPRSDAPRRLRSLGLQCFTEEDSDGFLALIPGPRDHDGVPDSLRFWLNWVDSEDPDTYPPVGVLYGPSGSGKSSYVRAGLFPMVKPDVCRVYVECRPGDLGGRLRRIVHDRLQDESDDSSLLDLLHRFRSGDSTSDRYSKLLIVLDQFETWSHSANRSQRDALAEALRQCDGHRIRTLVVARDDYWMGATELLRDLEIPLRQGRNIAPVGLMKPEDAISVLELMGRELGSLPKYPEPLSTDESSFLSRSVGELAIDGTVICVHLVMFAQMTRSQRWNSKSLRLAGGVSGACSLFLDELFSGRAAANLSPETRRVAPAAIHVLSLLTPAPGHVGLVMRSDQEIRTVLQQQGLEHLMPRCLEILIEELRLVTVVAPEAASARIGGESQDRYRLSHDFLREPVNRWIDRVRKRTWRGRAQARLLELSELWAQAPESALLPGLVDYVAMMAASRRGILVRQGNDLDARQQRFLRAATRRHAGRASVAIVALIGFAFACAFAWRQSVSANRAKESELASRVDLMLNGDQEDFQQQLESLPTRDAGLRQRVRESAASLDVNDRARSLLFLHRHGLATFDQLLIALAGCDVADVPLFVSAVRRDDSAGSALRAAWAESPPTDENGLLRARLAVLLLAAEDTSAFSELLSRTEVVTEAAAWEEWMQLRLDPTLWVETLRRSQDPRVSYAAGLMIASYPSDLVTGVSTEMVASMLSDPAIAVRSCGLFMAKHLGIDATVGPPPPEANWSLGPGGIAMARLPAETITYWANQGDPERTEVAATEEDNWLTVRPITRSVFQAFMESEPTMVDGSPFPPPVRSRGIPDSLFEDPDFPLLGINHEQVMLLIDWINREAGLPPAYQYEADAEPTVHPKMNRPFVKRWKLVQPQSYRLPTREEMELAIRCGYVDGLPLLHLPLLDELSGRTSRTKYEHNQPPLPYWLTIPNRRGFFTNSPFFRCWVEEPYNDHTYLARTKGSTFWMTLIKDPRERGTSVFLARTIGSSEDTTGESRRDTP